jgi:hypothetical protein
MPIGGCARADEREGPASNTWGPSATGPIARAKGSLHEDDYTQLLIRRVALGVVVAAASMRILQ